ncbi:MAG: class I SAM-dependent methyltransferase [Bacteroidota bacterium]|nr:class I SAM-dependent methyltransferase [Bacteroidota bacterium]
MSKFDSVAKNWDAEQKKTNEARKIFKHIRKQIKLNKKMTVADIGSGTGLLTMQLVPFVKSIHGYDNSKGMLTELDKKIEHQKCKSCKTILFDADINELPANKYDLIVSSMTFHHITDIDTFAEKMYKSIKAGGQFAIGDIETEDGSFHSNNSEVKHFGFEPEKFKTHFSKAGFSDITTERLFTVEQNEKKYFIFLTSGRKK